VKQQAINGKLQTIEAVKTKTTTVRIPANIYEHFLDKGHGALSRFILSAITEKWNNDII